MDDSRKLVSERNKRYYYKNQDLYYEKHRRWKELNRERYLEHKRLYNTRKLEREKQKRDSEMSKILAEASGSFIVSFR